MKAAAQPAPLTKLAQHRKDAELEAWICKRLALRDLFGGTTSTEIRRDRLRVTLLERGLTESIAGKFEGRPLTWCALFERLYHVSLN